MSYLNDLHKASSLNRGFRLVVFNSKCPTAAEHAGNEEINKTLEGLTLREMHFCASLSVDISYIRAWLEGKR